MDEAVLPTLESVALDCLTNWQRDLTDFQRLLGRLPIGDASVSAALMEVVKLIRDCRHGQIDWQRFKNVDAFMQNAIRTANRELLRKHRAALVEMYGQAAVALMQSEDI